MALVETLDAFLDGFRLWRRLRGGVWERWCVEPNGEIWHRVPAHPLKRWPHRRPSSACRGTPEIENYSGVPNDLFGEGSADSVPCHWCEHETDEPVWWENPEHPQLGACGKTIAMCPGCDKVWKETPDE